MPENLLVRFDALVARRGLAKNRSEVIRDLVRDALIDEECSMPGEEVMGTLTIVFNHHTGDVRDKLDTLRRLLLELMPTGAERTIIFVNYRESAERVAESLRKLGADPGLYTGALDQHDREKALALFNNGTRPLLVTTDLASRGLDISDVRNIIHYHQPLTAESYTHRNGRTARVDATGDAFVLIGPDEDVKEYIQFDDTRYLGDNPDGRIPASPVATLYISAGRKEKISRGDVVGFLVNQGSLPAKEIGAIDLHDHYTLVAIPRIEAKRLIVDIAPLKIKGRKPKYSIVK